MPVLKRNTNLQQVYLPSFEEENKADSGWVTLDTSPMRTGDIGNVEADSAAGDAAIQVVVDRITEWNLTDESGKLLDINVANVAWLPIDDFRMLQELIKEKPAGLEDEEKKTLKSTSSTEQIIETPPAQ